MTMKPMSGNYASHAPSNDQASRRECQPRRDMPFAHAPNGAHAPQDCVAGLPPIAGRAEFVSVHLRKSLFRQ